MYKDKLINLMKANKFEPFIREIVFTNFKNIQNFQKIEFTYPITALIGQNGTNKTSALVALYGSVLGKSPFEYWFSTPIDKAKGDEYQSYLYRYKTDDNHTAEVLMINNQRSDRDADRWETDKPRKKFDMNTDISSIQSEFKTSSRWKKIVKNVIYINFRSEISAFDRFFYHTTNPSKKLSKQEYIRSRSLKLKESIEHSLKSCLFYQKERIKTPSIYLSNEEVEIISKILGKKYESIQYIEHSFFSTVGGTAILRTSELDYSEAFAGSGEFAIISLVHKLSQAPEKSLILLDEPEVSLHPSAQKELMDFLQEEVLKKKHQVVFSTHSPEMINNLPNEAIKLFSEDKYGVLIDNDTIKNNAFYKIGRSFTKIEIYVEDALSKEIFEYIFSKNMNFKSMFDVKFLSGGAEAIIKRLPIFFETNNFPLIFLDGDKFRGKENSYPDIKHLADSELEDAIFNMFNVKSNNLNFYINGGSTGGDRHELYAVQRSFIENTLKCVNYLPFYTPERFILEQHKLLDSSKDDKVVFRDIVEEKIGNATSEKVLTYQTLLLRQLDINLEEFTKILDVLNRKLQESQ